jgi:hypothetical protein
MSRNDAYEDLNDLENDAVQIGNSYQCSRGAGLLHVTRSPKDLVHTYQSTCHNSQEHWYNHC